MNKEKRSPAVVAVGTVMLMLLGVLYTWSMFRQQISLAFPEFTAAQLSLNFTLAMICFCIGGFLGGKLSAWKTPRLAMQLASLLMLIGFFGTSFMDKLQGGAALMLMYVFYGAISGLATGIGYNACIGGISPWFAEKLGLVSGVLLMGFGLGSMFLGLLVQELVRVMSVFSIFRIYAVAIAVVTFAGSFALKKPPVPNETKNDGDKLHGCTPLQMISRPSFINYFLWNVIMSASGMLVFNSSATIAVAFGAAAAAGLIVSVVNGIGRPVVGTVMDKCGQFKGMMIINAVLIISGLLLVLGAVADSLAAVMVGLILVGICYGGGVTISAKVINDLYGPRHYAVNFSISNFCMIPAAFIGPYISGVLLDRAGGEYTSTFIMLLVMAVIAFVLIFPLKWFVKRENAKK